MVGLSPKTKLIFSKDQAILIKMGGPEYEKFVAENIIAFVEKIKSLSTRDLKFKESKSWATRSKRTPISKSGLVLLIKATLVSKTHGWSNHSQNYDALIYAIDISTLGVCNSSKMKYASSYIQDYMSNLLEKELGL